MKRVLAAAGITGALMLAGCGQSQEAGTETAEEAPAAATTGVSAAAGTPAPVGEATAALPAAPGAPVFAVIYPGATAKAGPVSAQGPAGPGGMVEFTTSASPETVVDFYRRQADAAGLKAITTLNRDGARGYAAGDGADGRGQMLNVVATPVEDGPTDVMLSWSSGR